MLAEVISIAVTGRRPAQIAQVRNPDEQRKLLFSVLLAGDAIVAIDNCTQPLGGTDLCSILTAGVYRDRFLGRSEALEVPTNSLFVATGNSLAFAGDMTRRALLATIDAGVERPEEREFQGDLRAQVAAMRAELVVAGLTVLRAFDLAGRPAQGLPAFGGFEAWSDWIRGALVWLDYPDPCAVRDQIRAADPERAGMVALLCAWRDLFGNEPRTTGAVAKLLDNAAGGGTDPKVDALREALDEALPPNRQITKTLGKYLARIKGRPVAGLRVEAAGEAQRACLWRVVADA